MENKMLLLSGIILSCTVTTIIIFQFIDSRHKRSYEKKYLYNAVKMCASLFLIGINLLQNPILNLLSWIILFAIISYVFYYDDINNPIQRILDAEVMILVFALCEAVGVVLLDYILYMTNIPPLQAEMKSFLNMTFSMIVLLFLYYAVISRIWGKREKVKFTRMQYILHFIITIYSFINMVVIVEVVGRIKDEATGFILLLYMSIIIFVDMYFLYFIQFVEESNQLKVKIELLEQQSAMQYKYYVSQEKKYQESFRILHDVDKHINVIEGLYDSNNKESAISYTKEISDILKPLLPKQITNHPILNILLNDKIQSATKLNIVFDYTIESVDLNFINPMDITTIFGNLLDNAIEACEKVDGNRWIKLIISPYYEMIAIRIENTSEEQNQWVNNRPISLKGSNHGIGLKNVERVLEKYEGTMQLSNGNGVFQCNVIMNL